MGFNGMFTGCGIFLVMFKRIWLDLFLEFDGFVVYPTRIIDGAFDGHFNGGLNEI